MTPEQIAAIRREDAKLRDLPVAVVRPGRYEAALHRRQLLAHIDTLTAAVEAALTSEDEIAHGEAYEPSRGGLGVCAYCDGEWPCRTQRGINAVLAILNGEHR